MHVLSDWRDIWGRCFLCSVHLVAYKGLPVHHRMGSKSVGRLKPKLRVLSKSLKYGLLGFLSAGFLFVTATSFIFALLLNCHLQSPEGIYGFPFLLCVN
jgi:hypothetical protein